MEELEIVREHDGQPLGIYVPRHEAISRGAWCRSTNVFVLNAAGEVLCHRRSLQKERLPGAWSTHLGGHVAKGETFETNALKELEEEAGIRVDAGRLLAWRTSRMPHARLWSREFAVLADVPHQDLRPQPGEVEAFAWMRPEDILREARRQPAIWCAGVHDFEVEYECIHAVLTAVHGVDAIERPRAVVA